MVVMVVMVVIVKIRNETFCKTYNVKEDQPAWKVPTVNHLICQTKFLNKRILATNKNNWKLCGESRWRLKPWLAGEYVREKS